MTSLPTKIVLATDGSEDAAAAMRAAVDIAVGSGSELHVVHSFEFIPPREYMSVALRLKNVSEFSDEGRHVLDEQVRLVEEAGGTVSGAHLRRGSPVDGILSVSEEIGAGLIVVGRRGLGGVTRLMMGSVSEGIVHNSRCPVLVLRRGEDNAWPPSHVIMADDSSEDALRSARLAASIGALFGAGGSLVQVYPRVLKTSFGGALETRVVEQALRGAETELRARALELEDLLGHRPETRLVVDRGAEGIDAIALTLIHAAQETGVPTLISVGSRGLGRITRARVGSVSTKVVRAADGPVLVSPQEREEDASTSPAAATADA